MCTCVHVRLMLVGELQIKKDTMANQSSLQLPHSLGRVCILGGGNTGIHLVTYFTYLKRHMPHITWSYICVYAGKNKASAQLLERAQGFCDVIDNTETVNQSFDVCITSPGIPPRSTLYKTAAAHTTAMMGEVEFVWRTQPRLWLGITGTNGKTTTTTLLNTMLHRAHIPSRAVGNIGLSCCEAACSRSDDEWFCAELSSFQLAETSHFHPVAAALLNITPDHIEWHGSMEAYAAAKEQIFAQLTADNLAIISRDDVYCRAIYERLCARGVPVLCVSTGADPHTQQAAYVENHIMYIRLHNRTYTLCDVRNTKLQGEHNIQNMLTASALALVAGADEQAISDVLLHFSTLEHRLEFVARIGSVDFVNDSKATNTDAAQHALRVYDAGKIVVLLGGHDKQTDLAALAHDVVRKCCVAVCYGQAGARIAQALTRELSCACAEHPNTACTIVCEPHLREAFDAAVLHAKPGDCVLLSPACSSFDEFANMEERGTFFKECVRTYAAKQAAAPTFPQDSAVSKR